MKEKKIMQVDPGFDWSSTWSVVMAREASDYVLNALDRLSKI
jgi:hypothetical protein